VSVAAAVTMAGGRIEQAALAFGGIAPLPWRDPAVEAALTGETPTPALFDRAADVLLAEARGQGANDFKIPLARRTLAAVLREATGIGEAA
jgi:xanthine dehydrogenase YagS FAD-binding subunit